MTKLIKSWRITNEDLENKILYGLLFTGNEDFHYFVDPQKEEDQTQTIELEDLSGTTFKVIKLYATEEKTYVHAKANEKSATFILPTSDVFTSILFGE